MGKVPKLIWATPIGIDKGLAPLITSIVGLMLIFNRSPPE